MAAAGNGQQGASLPAIGEAPTSGGYPCPTCGSRTNVTDSRASPWGWRRRRACASCGLRFTTIEIVYTSDLAAALRFKRVVMSKLRDLARIVATLEADGDTFDDEKDL